MNRGRRRLIRLVLTIVAAALLGWIFWIFSPGLQLGGRHPFEPAWPRIAVWAGLIGFAVLDTIVRRMRDTAADRSLLAGLKSEGRDDVEAVAERFAQAIAVLEAEGRSISKLPWFAIIGPPGVGKTTALVNSGLSFPLAKDMGKGPIAGVGGTRSCDWWFAEEAVLIDTAGRFTTQDSDREADAAAWTGFLRLLKHHRGRKALNGVILAFSVTDLLTLDDAALGRTTKAVRDRLGELRGALGTDLPIYVLVTKMDQIAGFVEFFDDLDAESRRQVWGFTLPLLTARERVAALSELGGEYDELVGRLNLRVVERLQKEQTSDRRSAVAEFPAQVASLKEPLLALIQEVFGRGLGDWRPALRGVYLSSATQLGTPIDRLRANVAKTFGLEPAALARLGGEGRSFFLTDLLRRIVVAEAWLVEEAAAVRFRRALSRSATAVIATVGVVAMAGWIWAFFDARGTIAEAEAGIAAYREVVTAADLGTIDDIEIAEVEPALAILRDLPGGWAERDREPLLVDRLGFDQRPKIGAQARAAYRRALNAIFLPRLLLRLEGQIDQNMDRQDYLYEALKVYLMLGGQGPLSADQVAQWMALDWRLAFPGDERIDLRDRLAGHLEALLSEPPDPAPLSGPLVERAQTVLRQVPLAERTYALTRQIAAGRRVADWRIDEVVGPSAAWLFRRQSGASISEGIEGLYTYDGFHRAFLPLLANIATTMAGEAWVLRAGAAPEDGPIEMDPEEERRLVGDVLGLYLKDFAQNWDKMLSDLTLAPMEGEAAAARLVQVTSGRDSPLLMMLVSAVLETSLSRVAEDPEARAAEAAVVELLGGERPWEAIDQRYGGLRALLTGETRLPPRLPAYDAFAARIGQMEAVFRPLPELPAPALTAPPEGATAVEENLEQPEPSAPVEGAETPGAAPAGPVTAEEPVE